MKRKCWVVQDEQTGKLLVATPLQRRDAIAAAGRIYGQTGRTTAAVKVGHQAAPMRDIKGDTKRS